MTDKALQTILNSITIICDTREHQDGNSANILSIFDKRSIPYIRRCLKFGDYSFEIPAFPEHGIPENISFENCIVFERKAHLTELSGCLCQSRERFENEFNRAKEAGAKVILLVEDGGWRNILEHKYRSELNEKSYVASLLAFKARYDLDIEFLPSNLTAWYMHGVFKYYAREYLKGDS